MARFKTTEVDVPMTFEHLHIFLKFRFSISIAITNTYLCTCMKFAMCDGQTDTDGRTHRQTDTRTDITNTVRLKRVMMLYSICLEDGWLKIF